MHATRPLLGCLMLGGCAVPAAPDATVDALDVASFCAPGDPISLRIEGENLLPSLAGGPGQEASLELLRVELHRSGDLFGQPDGLTVPPVVVSTGDPALVWDDPTALSVELGPEHDLAPGTWSVSVFRGAELVGELPGGLAIYDVPFLAGTDPGVLCVHAESAELALQVEQLVLPVDGTSMPSVSLAGSPMTVSGVSDCAPLVADPDLQVCQTVHASLDALVLPDAGAEVRVDSPEATWCGSPRPVVVSVLPAAEVASIDPHLTCVGGGTAVVTGDGFTSATSAFVGDLELAVTVLDSRHIEVELPAELEPGAHDIRVVVEGGCEADATASIDIVAAPEVFFVDPPVTHTSVSILATAMLTDVTTEITDVWLVDPSGALVDTEATWDPEAPNQLQLLLPAGLTPGAWGVGFETADGCGTELTDLFTVTDTLEVAVGEVLPPYAWAYDYTPVAGQSHLHEANGIGGPDHSEPHVGGAWDWSTCRHCSKPLTTSPTRGCPAPGSTRSATSWP